MSDTDQLTVKQLREDIEKEFLTAIQLIHTISFELEQLKHATNPGSDFEANIIQNAELMNKLIQMKQISLTNLIDENTFPSNQNMSQEDQNLDESEGL